MRQGPLTDRVIDLRDTETRPLRFAIVNSNDDRDRVVPYLPHNYDVQKFTIALPDGEVVERLLIVGSDVAGWTLEDYVIPRLASGLIFAEEISS